MKKTDWIVVDYYVEGASVMKCNRCLEMYPFPYGRLEFCVDVIEAFQKAHMNCVDKK